MQLPESVWRRRLDSEYNELSESGFKFNVNYDKTEYVLELSGRGYFYTSNFLTPVNSHKVRVRLNRSFPYPGGIEVTWLSPIFHPNIRSEDGKVCIHLLNNWSGLNSLSSLARGLIQLLENPNPRDALDKRAAEYFAKNFVGNKPVDNKPRIVSGV